MYFLHFSYLLLFLHFVWYSSVIVTFFFKLFDIFSNFSEKYVIVTFFFKLFDIFSNFSEKYKCVCHFRTRNKKMENKADTKHVKAT